MTKLEHFNECTSGPWENTKGFVTWKIVNGVMYFQCSSGLEDWSRNISVMPTITKIGIRYIFVPIGLDESWAEIKPVIRANLCHTYVGYSLGGQLAALASAQTGSPAIAFGCPNFFMGDKRLFWNTEFITHKKDVFTKLPWIYRKGEITQTLTGDVVYPKEVGKIERMSGHSPKAYRQLLIGVV